MLPQLSPELIAAVSAGVCGLLCAFVAVVAVGVLAWRMWSRREGAPVVGPPTPTRMAVAPAPVSGTAADRVFQMHRDTLGYHPEPDGRQTRERWGRPVTHTVPGGGLAERWSTPAVGRRIHIVEHDHVKGRFTPRARMPLAFSDPTLDARLRVWADNPADLASFVDPELRDRLMALPYVDVRATGEVVELVDPESQGLARALEPHGGQSARGTPAAVDAEVALHDAVADVLVMIADRVG